MRECRSVALSRVRIDFFVGDVNVAVAAAEHHVVRVSGAAGFLGLLG
jgi:hypothetical protein